MIRIGFRLDGAFEQELNRPQIAGLLVNLRGLGPPHRVGPVSRTVETGALDPTVDDRSVLSCRDVRLIMKAAREEVLPVPWNAIGDPIADCCSGLFGDFELDRSAGFPLDHRGTVPDSAPDAHVVDLEPHEVTAPQLAVALPENRPFSERRARARSRARLVSRFVEPGTVTGKGGPAASDHHRAVC
jgi:hypothetical protein